MAEVRPLVYLEASSLINPLAEAWRRAFEQAGFETVGVLTRTEESPTAGWVALHDLPDREPATIVSWWGLEALRRTPLSRRYPHAKHVLVVDTYPNASRPSTELREWVRAIGARRPQLLVTYSPEMSHMMRRRLLVLPHRQSLDLVQPFPLSAHRDAVEVTRPRSVIFTGTSNFLFDPGRSMRKDYLGPWLLDFVRAGYRVTLQAPRAPSDQDALRRHGFEFYPTFTNEQVLSGELAAEIARHSLQLAGYNGANTTVRRRMALGLSSRFSVGLTANTPMMVPRAAHSARAFLTSHGVGGAGSSPTDADLLVASGDRSRSAWRRRHQEWSTEAHLDTLRRIVLE